MQGSTRNLKSEVIALLIQSGVGSVKAWNDMLDDDQVTATKMDEAVNKDVDYESKEVEAEVETEVVILAHGDTLSYSVEVSVTRPMVLYKVDMLSKPVPVRERMLQMTRGGLQNRNISALNLWTSQLIFKGTTRRDPLNIHMFICVNGNEDHIEVFNVWRHAHNQFRAHEFKSNMPSPEDDELTNQQLFALLDPDSTNPARYTEMQRLEIGKHGKVCQLSQNLELVFVVDSDDTEYAILLYTIIPDVHFEVYILMYGHYNPNILAGIDADFNILDFDDVEPVVTPFYENKHVVASSARSYRSTRRHPSFKNLITSLINQPVHPHAA